MWEEIYEADPYTETDRLKVPGGWIVRTVAEGRNESIGVALTFVPDPGHKWSLEGGGIEHHKV